MLFATSILFSLIPSILAADSSAKPKATAKPCTLHSPSTGSYFDLNTIHIKAPTSKSSKDARAESWHSRGYDYGANFTINFCGPVVEDLGKVEGVSEQKTLNVSAYYKMDGKTYSIGEANTEPIFRGRKLVLNYTDGSPCPDTPYAPLSTREIIGGDDDDDFKSPPSRDSSIRRKSTIMSFLCDRDPQYTEKPQISFIGSPDSCSYYFEIRSRAACGGAASQSPSSLGPGGVFGVILLIAVCVYFIGGCAYQRTVLHQRGWRQVPNWGAWKGLFDLIGDTFIILTSSLTRALHLPNLSFNRAFNTGGYHRVGEDQPSSGYGRGGRGGFGSGGGASDGLLGGRGGGTAGGVGGRGNRGGNEDDENRLIDQLDEEWDD